METTALVNIGPRQRRLRRVMGTWTLVLALVLAAAAVALGWGTLVRLLLAPLFYGGFLGVLQSREHTCVALASRGLCNLDAGPQRIEDEDQRRALKAKARRLVAKSAGAAAAVTVVLLLLP